MSADARACSAAREFTLPGDRVSYAGRQGDDRPDGPGWIRLFDLPLCLLSIVAFDGRLQWVNVAWTNLLGYSTEELTGKLLIDLVHPDDRARTAAEAAQVIAGSPSVHFENRYRCKKDGTYRWLAWSSVPDPTRGLIYALALDITERRQAELAVAESEQQLHRILQGSTIPTFVIDCQHRVVHWNKALEELTSIAEAEITGTDRHWRAFYGTPRPCMADLLVDQRADALETWYTGKYHKIALIPEAYEGTDFFPEIGGAGRWLRFTAAAIRDSGGTLVAALETLEDITASRQIEEALRESEARYRGLFDGIPVGLFRTTPEGKVLDFNPAAATLLGFHDPHRAFAVTAQELWCDAAAREGWRAALEREGELRGFETQLRHVDGHAITVRLHSRAVRDARGQVLYYEGSLEDITERCRAAAEREKLETQLRQSQKLEAIGQLAGGIAHDFNNILTAILGNVELACQALEADPRAPTAPLQALRQIERSGQRAAMLTRQLLAFGRRQAAQPQLVDLNRVLADTEPMLRRLIAENIRLELVLAPNLGAVRIDPVQVDQVILNLVVNARDAMPGGGRLTIEAANALLDEAHVRAHPEAHCGPHVLLAISDTGCGMDRATRERIFEPFFTTKPVGHGTGLGLSTVYGIVKQAGGHLTVYSEPGRGSTFRLYLPAVPDRTADLHASPEEGGRQRGTETILVCEDDDDVRELSLQMLRDAGYQVLAAASGAEAQHAAAQCAAPIDLLLTDVIMPDMNGRDLSQALTKRQPGLRTLYVSGYTANVISQHGILAPDVEFMEKPFTRARLLRRVRDVLDNRAARPI